MPKRELKELRKDRPLLSVADAGEKEKHIRKERSVKKQIARKSVDTGKAAGKQIDGIEGIKKVYLKSRPACKVTFTIPKEAVDGAKEAAVVGDFNGWDKDASPMKRLKTGEFKVTLELPSSRDYVYRYVIDGCRWENDWCADEYRPNAYGSDDSVVIV
ncbi:MAG: hypothetical protein C4581_00605 [Nitrospiraceae bacterium]|nr:MAG: hypothetical protein C4581_00605 [Nitrospiraceae bacterium]